MDENEFKKILLKMCNLCARGEKCEFDILQKLNKLEIDDEIKNVVIEYLKKNNYINHQRYADAFVNDKFKFNKWGKQKIRQNLKTKRIEDIYIDKSLSSLNSDDYKDILLQLLKNKRKQLKEKNEFRLKQKLVNYAISKGFEMGVVLETISNNHLSQI